MDDKQIQREAAAAKIKTSPTSYKVCEGCGSIVARKAVVCPNCNAYRFDLAEGRVVEQAGLLALRPPMSIEEKDYI